MAQAGFERARKRARMFLEDYAAVLMLFVLLVAIIVVARIGFLLVIGPFPPSDTMPRLYLVFSVATVFVVHTIVYFFMSDGPESQLHRLEYLYLGIIAFGLLDIASKSTDYASYVSAVTGSTASVQEALSRQVQITYFEHCNDQSHLSAETIYCSRLETLRGPNEIDGRAIEQRANDPWFLKHPISRKQVYWHPDFEFADISGSIAYSVRALHVLNQSDKSGAGHSIPGGFAWFGLMFLPVGLGLRLVKTSLQHHGNLA